METCKLCGNPHKKENISCTFCTGDDRVISRVLVGAMYQKEFEQFKKISNLFPLATLLLLQYAKFYTNKLPQINSLNVGVWGGQRTGKTWLINAFLQSVLLKRYPNLLFSIIEGTPSADDVTAEKFAKSDAFNPFPIRATSDTVQKEFYFFRKKYSVKKDEDTMIVEPGVNSHIHKINLFDDTGGKLFDNKNGARLDHLTDEEQELATLARQRVAESNYIVLLISETDNAETILSGLSDIINRIGEQVNLNQPKKIAICLNKVERKQDFITIWKETHKLQEKDTFVSLLTSVFGKKSTVFIERLAQLEKFNLTKVKYFVLSSCGYCQDKKKINLDLSGEKPLEPENWEPINVLPVFEWFFSHIERKRIDCKDTVFLKFYNLPEWIAKITPKSETPYNQRMIDYIPYSTDHLIDK